VSLRQFNVYAGRGGESALQLVESGELSTSTLLSNVDRYSNLTIGVSLVNSAGLETAIERTVFVGSKHQTNIVVTFRVSHRRREMYCGHSRLCVCLSTAACLHYCTDPDVIWGSGRGCPLVVHYWADLQSVHGLHCYGKRRNAWQSPAVISQAHRMHYACQ